MRITVLGAGAMGALFGGYLSQHNDVWLVEVDEQKVQKIREDGIRILENDKTVTFHPGVVSDTKELEPMDLMIIFVKSMFTRNALETNRHLIGRDTYVMTLQNGAGHDAVIREFVPEDHIIIGTTKHNSSIIEPGYVAHGGGGESTIGLIGGSSDRLQSIADNFSSCGFETYVSDSVKEAIWNKLFINTSASVMTGILQTRLGFLADSGYGWELVRKLIREAVEVANMGGMHFQLEDVEQAVHNLLENAHGGYTSIYADIHNGVRTEVDTISGSVVEEAKRLGVKVPFHEFAVGLVHALEDKNRMKAD